MNKKVLIVIPAYNEAENIKQVIFDLNTQCPEYDYLIVDDCSNDETKRICNENEYHYIRFSNNIGIGGGVQAGYKYALERNYDIVVQHDGDGQHNPAYLTDVIEPILKDQYDIVIGSRYLTKEGFQSSAFRRAGINVLSKLIYLCSGVRIKDVTSGFRAVNLNYIKYYAKDYPQDYPEPEAIVSAKLNGARIGEVPVRMRERSNGVSSINSLRSVYYMLKVSCAILISRLIRRKKG